MTVTVETPAGEVSASSVSEVTSSKVWIRFEGMGWDYDLTGEAVVIEVTPGKYLFALLKGAGTTEYMGSVAGASISDQRSRVIDAELFDEVRDKRDRAAGVIVVPDYQYPMLVTFEDITDLASVKLVDPADLAASFGPGVRMKAMTLEVVHKAVTQGVVESVLNWILGAEFIIPPEKQPALLKDTTPEQRLSPQDFIDWKTLFENRARHRPQN